MKKDLESIAYENSLQYITTTTGRNGYPEHLSGAVIGFETWEEAEALARKEGLVIKTFVKRDGQQLWNRERGVTFHPMRVHASDYGDDYGELCGADVDSFFEDEVKPLLDSCDSFDDLKTCISNKEELLDKLELLDDDQTIITRCGDYYETINNELMEWCYDGTTWAIGLAEEE